MLGEIKSPPPAMRVEGGSEAEVSPKLLKRHFWKLLHAVIQIEL